MDSHQPVLVGAVVDGLDIQPSGIYIDATFGRGGHSLEILKRLGTKGRLIALDQDPAAVAVGKTDPFQDPRFSITGASFAALETVVREAGVYGQVNGVLLDLGVSSPQLEDPARGFSFRKDGPLDMRMNPTQHMDAATWINQVDEAQLSDVIRDYGEERFAKRIARVIIRARNSTPITRTVQLAELIQQAIPMREQKREKIHPATRTFQAIRIFINQELQALRTCLSMCVDVLIKGGRLCVISFHSLEDRIVKQFIAKESEGMRVPRQVPMRAQDMPHTGRLRKIGSLIQPNDDEIRINRRARSARLRIAEKIL